MYWRIGKYELGFVGRPWVFRVTRAACECTLYECGPVFLTLVSKTCDD